MARPTRSASPISGRYAVLALGALYLLVAGAWAVVRPYPDVATSNVLVVTAFIAAPGAALLVGGYRLPRTDVHPRFHSTVTRWCLAGGAAMLAILGLWHLQPGSGITEPLRSVPVLTGLSCVAGFGVGIYDARAKTHAHELERRNRERERIQRRLEESNERLEQFAYVASHDLREPLRMVSSYLQLVERRYGDELDAEGEEFVEYAIDGADRMREMIDALLEYSRVDTQGDPFEPVDLDDVVADASKNLEVRIEETDADVTVGDLPRVRGDERQLRQLFQNLLSNALEYSGDDPPRVHVDAERDGPEWLVSVRDEGIGIDPDDQERIFEVFQRLHGPGESSGTGIGLALCRRIAERHDGEIRVDSEPGEGSTFTVALPPADASRRESSAETA